MDRLFWAKLRGYPWWPAIIESFDGLSLSDAVHEDGISQIPVRFLGSHDFAIVTRTNLKPFLDNWNLYSSKGSSPKFKQAVKEAQDLISFPLADHRRKKSRGRPPKSVAVLREKRARLIKYCESRVCTIIGRRTVKESEIRVARRLLHVLTLFEEKELQASAHVGSLFLRDLSRYIDSLQAITSSSEYNALRECAGKLSLRLL